MKKIKKIISGLRLEPWLVLALAFVPGAFVSAMPPWLAQTQKMGFTHINGCLSCHTNEPNRKSEKGGVGFNERGEWLLKLKDERFDRSKEAKPMVKLEWLKDDPFKNKELEKENGK